MKIATKTGDDGSTGLFGGSRVSKSALVIEVLGCLDELQAFLGWCKVCANKGESENGTEIVNNLDKIQDDLYGIMGGIGGGDGAVSEKDVAWIEALIEKYESVSEGAEGFVKPGKNELSARFHIARTVCRRAERVFVKFMKRGVKKEASDLKIIEVYLNRLSDLLFLLGIL